MPARRTSPTRGCREPRAEPRPLRNPLFAKVSRSGSTSCGTRRSPSTSPRCTVEARFEEHHRTSSTCGCCTSGTGPSSRRRRGRRGRASTSRRSSRTACGERKRILDERHGVLVADDVGLGKTFIAGELIREAVGSDGSACCSSLPPTLRDGPWRKFLADSPARRRAASPSRSWRATAQLNPDANGTAAHLRDQRVRDGRHRRGARLPEPETLRAASLRRLLAGSPPKDARPADGDAGEQLSWDLYYLLATSSRTTPPSRDAGIRSLRDHFAKAMAPNPDDLSPEHLFDVLDEVAVRRTRHFVKTLLPERHGHRRWTARSADHLPEARPIRSPTTSTTCCPGFFDRFAHALDCADRRVRAAVRSPRVRPSRLGPLRRRRVPDSDGADGRGVRGAGGRAPSVRAAEAVRVIGRRVRADVPRGWPPATMTSSTCSTTGSFATGDALSRVGGDRLRTSSMPWSSSAREAKASTERATSTSTRCAPTCERPRPAAARSRRRPSRSVRDHDPKLQRSRATSSRRSRAEAEHEACGETDERDKRKVLVFSYFADTVDWIIELPERTVVERERLAAYRGRVAAVSGDDALATTDALRGLGFAPLTTDAPEAEERPLRHPGRDRRAGRGREPPAGSPHHQLRPAVEPDAARPAARPHRPDRQSATPRSSSAASSRPRSSTSCSGSRSGCSARSHRQLRRAIGVEDEVLPGSQGRRRHLRRDPREIERLRDEDATLFETRR